MGQEEERVAGMVGRAWASNTLISEWSRGSLAQEDSLALVLDFNFSFSYFRMKRVSD